LRAILHRHRFPEPDEKIEIVALVLGRQFHPKTFRSVRNHDHELVLIQKTVIPGRDLELHRLSAFQDRIVLERIVEGVARSGENLRLRLDRAAVSPRGGK